MTEEHGIVTETKGSVAVIRAKRTSACDSCASKKSCATGGPGEVCLEVDNSIGARAGDSVIFTVGAASVMKAGVLLYLVPIVSFIVGVVAGQAVAPAFPDVNKDLVSGVFGVVFLAAAFIALRLYGRSIEKNSAMRPRILRID